MADDDGFGVRINKSVGLGKNKGSGNMPSLFKSENQGYINEATKNRQDKIKANRTSGKSSYVAKEYSHKETSEEKFYNKPISRFVVYPVVCGLSFGLGFASGYCNKHNVDIPGLIPLLDYGTPVAGGLIGVLHEINSDEGHELFGLPTPVLGGIGGISGAYISMIAGRALGSVF